MRLVAPLILSLCLLLTGIALGETDYGNSRPKSVTADCLETSADVSWAPVMDDNLLGYNVYWKLTEGTQYTQANSEIVTTTTYQVTQLSFGLSHDFGVIALLTGGHSSDMSSPATCATG